MEEPKTASHSDKDSAIRLERVACPKCGSMKSRLMYQGKDYLHKIDGVFFAAECTQCKFSFQNPRPFASDINKLYPSDYVPHAAVDEIDKGSRISLFARSILRNKYGYSHLVAEPHEPFSWKSLPIFNGLKSYICGVDLIPHFIADGKLLEIGCASGARLLSLRKLGWKNLYGIELVPEAVAKARAQGFPVQCGQIEDTIDDFPDNYFDVIITSMVLEHLLNPFIVFQKIAKKLKPGGQLLFSTVIRNSIDARLYKGYWVGFDFPRHMVYFRKKDLMEILENRYENIQCFRQNAPIDFKRSSTWRIRAGKGNILDKLMVAIAGSLVFRAFGYGLAWLGLTSRISFKALKQNGV